jgi:hypothetical protein
MPFKISKAALLDYKYNEYWALALEDCSIFIKQSHTVVSPESVTTIKAPSINSIDHSLLKEGGLGKIYVIQLFAAVDSLVYGTSTGYIIIKSIANMGVDPDRRQSILQKSSFKSNSSAKTVCF